MGEQKVGALIIIKQSNDLGVVVESGIAIDAQAVAQILEEMGLAKSKSDKAMLNILRKFSYTTLTTNEDCEVEWIIAFQDANTNALKQIKDMAISSAISSAF
jgi:hypothetical protein